MSRGDTANTKPLSKPVACRGVLSEGRKKSTTRERTVTPEELADHHARLVRARETMMKAGAELSRVCLLPWDPRVGGFVSVDNGWGTRSRAEIVLVPQGPELYSIAVRFLAYQTEGPWVWLELASRGAIWWEEA